MRSPPPRAAGRPGVLGTGIQGSLLWGVLMAFLSLLLGRRRGADLGAGSGISPGHGRPLARVGAWIAFCVLVIGTVDNIMRPILVGKDTEAARLGRPDFDAGRHGPVRPERFCHRSDDRRAVHRGVGPVHAGRRNARRRLIPQE